MYIYVRVIWVKVFKIGPIKVCRRQPLKNLWSDMICLSRPYHFKFTSNFWKDVIHKFYLVHSWIPWPICYIVLCSVINPFRATSFFLYPSPPPPTSPSLSPWKQQKTRGFWGSWSVEKRPVAWNWSQKLKLKSDSYFPEKFVLSEGP